MLPDRLYNLPLADQSSWSERLNLYVLMIPLILVSLAVIPLRWVMFLLGYVYESLRMAFLQGRHAM